MKIVVSGTVRTRISTRGLFRSEKWDEKEFSVEFGSDDIRNATVKEVTDQFFLSCEDLGERVFVNGNIKNQKYVLGELSKGQKRVFNYAILSVAGIDISGRISTS